MHLYNLKRTLLLFWILKVSYCFLVRESQLLFYSVLLVCVRWYISICYEISGWLCRVLSSGGEASPPNISASPQKMLQECFIFVVVIYAYEGKALVFCDI